MTKQSTNTSQQSLRALLADDTYVAAFQTVGQYRAALLRHDAMRRAAPSTGRTLESNVTLEEALYALDLVINKMNVPGLTGQRGYAADVLERAAQFDGRQSERNAS